MIEPGATRMFFNDLKEMSIEYFLTGSVACDALRGEWTRDHNDVDIFVRTRSLSKLLDSLPGHYQAFKKGNLYLLKTQGFDADVYELIENGDHLLVEDNSSILECPRQLFEEYQKADFPAKMMRVANNEILLFTTNEKDQEFIKSRPYDKELAEKIIKTQLPPVEYKLEPIYE